MKVKSFNKLGEKLMGEKQVFTYFLVLTTVFLSIFSCKNEIGKKDLLEKKELIEKINDSINIRIKFKDKGLVFLHTSDNNFYSKNIKFSGNFSKDTVIQRRVKKNKEYQIFKYGAFIRKNNKSNLINQYFMITPQTQIMNLEFSKMKLYDNNSYYSNELNHIFKSYDTIKLKILKNEKKASLAKELEIIYKALDKRYSKHSDNKILQLCKTLYIDVLQRIDNKNPKIKEYLKNMNNPVLGGPFEGLIFNNIKHNINEIDFENLNSEKYSKKELHYRAAGLFNFLKNEDNKGDVKYKKAINWLKSTEFYKKDSLYIKKNITPLDNSLFKEKLKQINLSTIDKTDESLTSIIKKHPSKYYLIDFWATWCAPCIGGVKLMNKMDFPKNVKVLSISLDKEKDIEKWKQKTKELKQQYTYWLDEKSAVGKSFLQFIELQSIPRYILIDKDLNLIDQAFYHPNEPQFLNKLKDIKNHKYW